MDFTSKVSMFSQKVSRSTKCHVNSYLIISHNRNAECSLGLGSICPFLGALVEILTSYSQTQGFPYLLLFSL